MSRLPNSERLDRLRLIRSQNIGPTTFRLLLRRFGSAGATLAKIPEIAARVGGRRIKLCPKSRAQAEMDKLESLGGFFVMIGDGEYPRALAVLDHSPPVLSVMGHAHLLKKTCVAIVGTRNASAAALTLTEKFAAEIGAADHIIVSGMALGVDAIAHQAALATGTIAVLGGGVDVIYPPQNKQLYEDICTTGCVISEMSLGTQPRAQHFPRRNRIISGLSLLVIIVEAPMRSGAMITARLAGEQGRLVCAVPGSPIDPRARGTNHLIREGATIVESSEDVLNELRPLIDKPIAEDKAVYVDHAIANYPQPTKKDHDYIKSFLGPAPTDLDKVIQFSGKSASEVNVIITELEMSGQAFRDLGNRISLIEI